jgi:hypothetical protein
MPDEAPVMSAVPSEGREEEDAEDAEVMEALGIKKGFT